LLVASWEAFVLTSIGGGGVTASSASTVLDIRRGI
jgi:hypothetical protein